MALFRKIRFYYSLRGKTRQYLFYALGEIALIVLGILLALAIDNQSTQQARRKKEQIYLIGLQEEFQISERKLAELIRVNQESMEGARTIARYIAGELLPPDEEQFSDLLYRTFAYDIAFNPNNSLLQEMINSGSLKDISNSDLKVAFTTWMAALDDIGRQEATLDEQRAAVLAFFRKDTYSVRTLFDQAGVSAAELGIRQREGTKSNLPLLTDLAFENNVLLFMSAVYSTEVRHYLPLKADLEAILQLIEAEIH